MDSRIEGHGDWCDAVIVSRSEIGGPEAMTTSARFALQEALNTDNLHVESFGTTFRCQSPRSCLCRRSWRIGYAVASWAELGKIPTPSIERAKGSNSRS